MPLYVLALGDCRQAAAHVSCFQEIAGDSAFSLGMVADFTRTLEEEGAWAYRRLFWETGLIGQVLYLEAEAAGVRSTGMGCYFDDLVHRLLDLNPSELGYSTGRCEAHPAIAAARATDTMHLRIDDEFMR